jgi:hypothetical protein
MDRDLFWTMIHPALTGLVGGGGALLVGYYINPVLGMLTLPIIAIAGFYHFTVMYVNKRHS